MQPRRTVVAATMVLSCALYLTTCVVAEPQEKTERLVLELRTETTAPMMKMPPIPNIPGMPKIPGLEAMMGLPTRVLEGKATYPHAAVAPIFVQVPADLKLPQNRLVLEVPKPVVAQPTPTPTGPTGPPPTGKIEITTKLYWHPDEAQGPITNTVSVDLSKMPTAEGQDFDPRVLDRANEEPQRTAHGSATEFPEAAVGRGDYILNTGGSALLDGFLPAIKVTRPETVGDIIPENGVDITWEPVAGARGYIVHGTGMVGQMRQGGTTILWVSTLNQPPERVIQGYEQATTISDDLRDGILLPPGTVSCRVPKGIFAGVSMLVLDVTAVGNDYYDTAGGITVRGRIRAVWRATKMAGMTGVPGAGRLPRGGRQRQ